jgi:hypothetical protein
VDLLTNALVFLSGVGIALAAIPAWKAFKRWRRRQEFDSARSRARRETRAFEILLPEELHRDPLTYESNKDINYRAFFVEESKLPLSLLRYFQMDFVRQLPAGEASESLMQPGSQLWFLAIFGVPWAVPCEEKRFESLLREFCPRCEARPSFRGQLFAPAGRALATYACDCGRGFTIWRPDEGPMERYPVSPELPPGFVFSFVGGPRLEEFELGFVVPTRFEDPVPPTALVFHAGSLVGALAYLEGSLIFTNDLGLALEDVAPPIPLSRKTSRQLETSLRGSLGSVVDAFRGARDESPNGRTIWFLAELPGPELEEDQAPLKIREWFGPELRDGRGRSPNNPLLVFNPRGEQRFLRSVRCPSGQPFDFRRTGSRSGRCPEPEAHRRLMPISGDDLDPREIIVDEYQLKCRCGEHAGTLYFDMYHPETESDSELDAVPGFDAPDEDQS